MSGRNDQPSYAESPYMKASQSNTLNQYKPAAEKIRSPLQMAGGMISSTMSHSSRQPYKSIKQNHSLPAFKDKEILIIERPKKSVMDEREKQLIPILTLRRLRKMQALVRGFLTRRLLYPVLLRQHRLCESVYHDIRRRVSDKLITQVVLQVITFNKYNDNLSLHSLNNTAITSVVDDIIERVVFSTGRQLVNKAIEEMTRNLVPVEKVVSPLVTFNLTDPTELLIYDLLLREIAAIKREVAQSAIFDIVDEIRLEGQIRDNLLQDMMQSMYQEVVKETLEEYAAHDIIENMIDQQTKQATEAVVQYEFQKAIKPLEVKAQKELDRQLLILLISESLLEGISQLE